MKRERTPKDNLYITCCGLINEVFKIQENLDLMGEEDIIDTEKDVKQISQYLNSINMESTLNQSIANQS